MKNNPESSEQRHLATRVVQDVSIGQINDFCAPLLTFSESIGLQIKNIHPTFTNESLHTPLEQDLLPALSRTHIMATRSKPKFADQTPNHKVEVQPSPPPQKNEGGSEDDSTEFISKMALYDLERADSVIKSIQYKPEWTAADTASFDCMHYDGNAALDHCARMLGLDQEPPHQRILDIGSGFSGTGRYFASKYKAIVTGIELQKRFHELAKEITRRSNDERVRANVRSVNADFLKLDAKDLVEPGEIRHVEFDHVVSLLCIMHFSKEDRVRLFKRAHESLKINGTFYIEDFYHRKLMTDDERAALRDVVSCTYLPIAPEYITDTTDAEFVDAIWEDVTVQWQPIVRARAEEYRRRKGKKTKLERFYDTVAELFESGNVGV